MDNEIWESIKHIKNISKKKVTADKIFTNIKKKDSSISFDELLEILDTMVKDGILHENGMDKSKTYMIPENADSVFVPDTQYASNTSDENPEIILEETNLEEKSRQEDISSTQSDKILNEIKNFKKFQADVQNKLSLLEDAIISGKYSFKEDTSDNNTSRFAINILKDRISSLEDEVKSKDAIIAFLTQQLLSSKLDNSQMKRCECNRRTPLNVDESIADDTSTHEPNLDTDNEINSEHKRKVVITGDSLLNGLNEKGLSRNHRVKVNNFPGGTSETILENIDEIIKNKPDCLIIHAGTNDLTNGINLLNQAKKIIKEVKKVSHNTKIAFSSIITRKDRKNIDKKVLDVNSHLKNYCSQKNIDFIDNNNIKEEHLGVKKLHLNKRGNSVLASNILKYLRFTF